MKVQELRIGNIIDAGNNIPGTVIAIGSDECIFTSEGSGHISEFSEIPITEVGLIKLGFEENYRSKFHSTFEHPDFLFIEYTFGYTGHHVTSFKYYGERNIACKYVHSLQNIFYALTGKELCHT